MRRKERQENGEAEKRGKRPPVQRKRQEAAGVQKEVKSQCRGSEVQ